MRIDILISIPKKAQESTCRLMGFFVGNFLFFVTLYHYNEKVWIQEKKKPSSLHVDWWELDYHTKIKYSPSFEETRTNIGENLAFLSYLATKSEPVELNLYNTEMRCKPSRGAIK